MSEIHALRPKQIVQEPNGTLHRDLFRWLSNLGTVINLTGVPPSGVIMVSLTTAQVTANFDATGLGNRAGPYAGWAICNGNNGTPNLSSDLVRMNVTGAGATGAVAAGAGQSYQELVPLMRMEIG
jgi:hypothetical protein